MSKPILAILFLLCVFLFAVGEFAVVPGHKYDPGNIAYDAVLIVAAAVIGYFFVRRTSK